MTPEAATGLALQGLAFVAGNEAFLTRFMADSGLSQDDLRSRMDDPVLLGFVLDFVLGQEALAREFCAIAELKPESLLRARAALPGGIGDWA